MMGRSAFFNTPQAAGNALRDGYLTLAISVFPVLATLGDTFFWAKVLAAESEIKRLLTVPLEPTEVFTDEPSQAEIDALAGKPYQVEPGYDLPPDYFGREKWGALQLRLWPVIQILSMKLAYPSFPSTVFEVPADWIRVDKPYGWLQVFPSTNHGFPASLYTVQLIAGGFTVPNMIRVRYQAGLTDTHQHYPDIYDLVLRLAVAKILADPSMPQSESISADGLSQSRSLDVLKNTSGIYEQITSLKQQLRGPLFTVV